MPIDGTPTGVMAVVWAPDDKSSIAALLTQQSGASASVGNQIYPDKTGAPEFRWKILSGTYAGTYDINRNDPQGLSYWAAANAVAGAIGFDQFYNYRHWTDEHTYDGEVMNNSSFDIMVELVINDGTSGPYTYFTNTPFSTGLTSINGGPVTYYYQHFMPNADFEHTINLDNSAPFPVNLVQLRLTDIDTGFNIADFVGGPPISIPPGPISFFTPGLPFFRRYSITIEIAP
jgi:hypothetical protein